MIFVILVLLAVLLVQHLRLHLQILRWSADLEGTESGSNLTLTASFRSRSCKRLCRAFNRRLAQEQSAAVSQQRAAQELKYTISCISHDIRTPLAGAAGYVELLLRTDDREKAAAYLSVVSRRLSDLEKLLDELFLYTKLALPEFTVSCAPVAPYPVLCRVLASYYDRVQEAGAKLTVDFPEPSVRVNGSEDALTRIFTNLLQNALVHGRSDGLFIRITQDGPSVTFSNPLPDRELPDVSRLFDRFYQADPSRHKKSSGLGLSIVRQLARKMGGDAFASLNKETLSVTVALPRAQAEEKS